MNRACIHRYRVGGRTMKYLCLVYSDEQLLHSLPDSPKDPECHAYAGSLYESGRMIAGEALQPVATASTVRVRGGKTVVTDGPFAETKEQLAGFYLVEARDMNEEHTSELQSRENLVCRLLLEK